MISGEKILVTGVTGMVATPLALALAQQNEVWGVARFADPAARTPYEAAGITTLAMDLGEPDFSVLPADFTYVLHLGWTRAPLSELQRAIRTNVEGPGLLLQHCRSAKATLVMSGMGVYSPHPDPWHLYSEHDPIGRAATAYAPTSPACKLGVEAVVRMCARAFSMPIVITRLNTFMGPPRSLPAQVVRKVQAGECVTAPHDPNPQTPIHVDDMIWQLEPLLAAASVPATIVNWCGDETVTMQEWVHMAAEMSGTSARLAVMDVPGAPPGSAADGTFRKQLTGPSRIRFREAFTSLFHQCESAAPVTSA